jgi:predicted enzyme related to lactoylglutathione lyase
MPCPVVWFEALGQHGDKLHDFYGEVLGWRFDPPPAVPIRSKASAARPRALGSAAATAEAPWFVTFYARVPDLDAAIEKARARGSRLLVGPTRHGASTIAVISDPAGHPLGLCS